MDHKTLRDMVQSARLEGQRVMIQCLPKTGSTSITEALRSEGAVHELDMTAVLGLARLRSRATFAQQRRQWLRARQKRLQGRVDVCTALALVVADLSDPQLAQEQLVRLRLNRSLRPWLHSIVNWSLIHGANAYRQSWSDAYAAFVAGVDRELAALMPSKLDGEKTMVQFWIPVWLVYQHHLNNMGPTRYSTILTDRLNLGIRANQSHFSTDYDRRFADLLPDLPDFDNEEKQNHQISEQLRSWWVHEARAWRAGSGDGSAPR